MYMLTRNSNARRQTPDGDAMRADGADALRRARDARDAYAANGSIASAVFL
jgi:hypothetical protein